MASSSVGEFSYFFHIKLKLIFPFPVFGKKEKEISCFSSPRIIDELQLTWVPFFGSEK